MQQVMAPQPGPAGAVQGGAVGAATAPAAARNRPRCCSQRVYAVDTDDIACNIKVEAYAPLAALFGTRGSRARRSTRSCSPWSARCKALIPPESPTTTFFTVWTHHNGQEGHAQRGQSGEPHGRFDLCRGPLHGSIRYKLIQLYDPNAVWVNRAWRRGSWGVGCCSSARARPNRTRT